MRTKVKRKLTLIWVLLSLAVISLISITAVFALTQQFLKTEVGVDYATPSIDVLTFTESSDGTSYSITACDNDGLSGTTGVVIIPKTYNDKPVTEIADTAFIECSNLKEVVIQDGVTSIGSSAFNSCSNLTKVTISKTVTLISINAFIGCYNLTSAIFQDIEGWFLGIAPTATSGTDLSSTDLADTSTAATYLQTTYYSYYWIRSAS